MPFIWVYYLGMPFVFTFLIYNRGLRGWKLFLATLIAGTLLELDPFQNALLVSFSMGIPLAICLYVFITIVPYCIVEKKG